MADLESLLGLMEELGASRKPRKSRKKGASGIRGQVEGKHSLPLRASPRAPEVKDDTVTWVVSGGPDWEVKVRASAKSFPDAVVWKAIKRRKIYRNQKLLYAEVPDLVYEIFIWVPGVIQKYGWSMVRWSDALDKKIYLD